MGGCGGKENVKGGAASAEVLPKADEHHSIVILGGGIGGLYTGAPVMECTYRHIDIQTQHRHIDTHTDTQTHRQTDTRDTDTDTQTHRHTDTQTHTDT